MENENTDFELTNENIENWEKAEFWESDPMQNNQSLCRIILYVNWEKKTATVETQMDTNSMAGEVWHSLASEFNLPEDTDFEEFPKFFNEEVKPLLQKIGSGYESFWNGSNWKGSFTEEAHETTWELIQLLDGANVPTHDMIYSFDIMGAFQSKSELVDYLEREGIDLRTIDLENKMNIHKIMNSIESGEVVIAGMDENDYKTELKEIQEELREEEEEDSE